MLTVGNLATGEIVGLLRRFDLRLVIVDDDSPIQGSYWGDPEAGIIGNTIYARGDTPIHSLLHETCHVICMTETRRDRLCRDAGGDYLEESAVCYLQVLLADCLQGVVAQRLVPRVGGGLALAQEILVVTGTVREALKRPDSNPPLKELMERGQTPYGMQTFQMAIRRLVKSGVVSKEVGQMYLT